MLAILDWELATAGPPFADVAYLCLAHRLPPGVPALPSLPLPLPAGVPTEAEIVRLYCDASGRAPPPAPAWRFFVALALFRAAAILAGVGARAAAGNAASAHAAAAGSPAVVAAVAAAGLRALAGDEEGPAATSVPPGLGPSPRAAALLTHVNAFMEDRIAPLEAAADAHASSAARWAPLPFMPALTAAAKGAGLWNLWLPGELRDRIVRELGADAPPLSFLGPGLSNLDYAHLATAMGAIPWASEAFNCSAPDTGNMEVLARYGTGAQMRSWLLPLLAGEWRSAFGMTEPAVASSDATNIRASIVDDGQGSLTLSGTKWWTSGALDPRCRLLLAMGRSNPAAPAHKQQSIVAIPLPCPGVVVGRALTVYGYDDAPHGHAVVDLRGATVPSSNMILGPGRGFEIAQGRLGPGRLHHCARLLGAGDRALSLAAARARARVAFGGPLAAQSSVGQTLARRRVALEGARLLTLHAAASLDAARGDAKAARLELAAAKVAAPAAALAAIDAAVQLHGGAGVSGDTPLARLWAGARTLRLADGPDEVHLATIAKAELREARL